MDKETLLQYYASLLIIQYINKPKANATIKAFIKPLLPINNATGNLLLKDIMDAFNIDTAVGRQLDWLGQWVGVDRLYNGFNFQGSFFSLADFNINNQDSLVGLGFSDFVNDITAGGVWLDFNNILSFTNKLNDDDFRLLIKLKILQNTSNHSWFALVTGLADIFGDNIYIGTNGAMHMAYFVPLHLTALISAIVAKKILPHPLCVTISGLVPILDEQKYFGYYDLDCAVIEQYSLLSEVPDIALLIDIETLTEISFNSPIGGYADFNSDTILGGLVLDETNVISV